jgi:hypothetical protein
VSAQTAIVLAAAEVLDVQLGGRVSDHFAKDPHAFQDRLANARVLTTLIEQDAIELQPGAYLDLAVVYLDSVSLTDPVLPGPILEHCVHCSLPLHGLVFNIEANGRCKPAGR